MIQTASGIPAETNIILTIALMMLCGVVVVFLATRLGQPPVIGEIVAGIMLGPSLLGLFPGDLHNVLLPVGVRQYLDAIAQIGVLLFMFCAGWELNPAVIRGRRTTIAVTSGGTLLVPFLLGISVAQMLYPMHSVVDGAHVDRLGFVLFLGAALSITAFPVLARILVEKGIQGGKLGSMALACAAVGDVAAWCVLAAITIASESAGAEQLIFMLSGTMLFIGGCRFVLRPLIALLLRRVQGRSPQVPVFVVASAGVLLSASVTSLIGVHAIFGAFMLGLTMPKDEWLHQHVAVPFGHISGFLLPIFFIVSGQSVDVTALGGSGVFAMVVVFVAACVGKFVGAVLPARLTGMSWRDSAGLGVLMNARGLTELVVLDVGRQLHLIDGMLYTVLVLMAVATTAMTAPLLGWLGVSPSGVHPPSAQQAASATTAGAASAEVHEQLSLRRQ